MIELYRLAGCPFCRRVEQTLETLDLEYVTHDVPAQKSQRETVQELSGQSGVPVIVDEANGIEGMAESADIVEYLEATYG